MSSSRMFITMTAYIFNYKLFKLAYKVFNVCATWISIVETTNTVQVLKCRKKKIMLSLQTLQIIRKEY